MFNKSALYHGLGEYWTPLQPIKSVNQVVPAKLLTVLNVVQATLYQQRTSFLGMSLYKVSEISNNNIRDAVTQSKSPFTILRNFTKLTCNSTMSDFNIAFNLFGKCYFSEFTVSQCHITAHLTSHSIDLAS